MIELNDTIGLMCSDDYKDRLKAEYIQLMIRMHKLSVYWQDMEDRVGAEGGHMMEQLGAMRSYKIALRKRLLDNGLVPDSIDKLFEGE